MAVQWTKHRFTGGAFVLDVANTVVLRGDPRSFDRFADPGEIDRFAAAAIAFRADELGGRPLDVDQSPAGARTVIALREAADRLFRSVARDGGLAPAILAPFLRACADGLDGGSAESKASGFLTALSVSALSLLAAAPLKRLRICPNCSWLFLDRSRNASRIWCDMAVCGNRQKARKHYRLRARTGKENSDV